MSFGTPLIHGWKCDVDVSDSAVKLKAWRYASSSSISRASNPGGKNFSPQLRVAPSTRADHSATVLHCDNVFDLVAFVTGQPTRWIIPSGRGHRVKLQQARFVCLVAECLGIFPPALWRRRPRLHQRQAGPRPHCGCRLRVLSGVRPYSVVIGKRPFTSSSGSSPPQKRSHER